MSSRVGDECGGTTAAGTYAARARHADLSPGAGAGGPDKKKDRPQPHVATGPELRQKKPIREEPYPMTNPNWLAEFQRANRLEYAAERLRGRGMNHKTVQAAAAELAKLDGAPVQLEELAELNTGRGRIHWRAGLGHRIYRPATVQQYDDLTGMLFAAGYPVAPYPEYEAYAMTNPDGTRGRCSVVIVKPSGVNA